jgi:hypothetical protein
MNDRRSRIHHDNMTMMSKQYIMSMYIMINSDDDDDDDDDNHGDDDTSLMMMMVVITNFSPFQLYSRDPFLFVFQ